MGLNIYPFTSIDEILQAADEQKPILVAMNAEKIVNATPQTKEIINSNLGYCDGMGAVKAVKQKGAKNAIRIPGCELWLHIIKRFENEKSFYFLGAKQEVIDQTIEKLKTEFPNINIAGYRNGYLNDDTQRQEVIDTIAELKPDVVFVAMGSPKQELLMADMQKRHRAIYQGLGGSFDVYSGNAQRAPEWWQKHNLEFAYRFVKNPKRFKRQIPILKFATRLLFHRI